MATEITDILNYIAEIKGINHEKHNTKVLFYRGVSKKEYKLEPTVLRAKENYIEKDILLDFMQYLPQNGLNYDYIKDRVKVLADMQHYRLPTRLLDWTISPLAALFFACKSKPECDGKVFILNPWVLWKHIITDPKVAEIHDAHILARALLSDGRNIKEINKILINQFDCPLVEKKIELPFPFIASFCNDRIVAQRGCFTIHGCKSEPMEDLIKGNYGTIKQIIIPQKAKQAILDDLNLLSINDHSLFPDFYGMEKMFKKYGSLFNLNRRESSDKV